MPLDAAESLHLDLAAMTPPLEWTALFGRDAPQALEIGTGNGYFLENEAAAHPDWNFMGIERAREFYWKMVRRCWRRGLINVRTADADAHDLLRDWIPAASLDRVYLYFTDPWPKRRHARRRVFNEDFPDLLERALRPGGELRFKTDVGWLFNLTVTLLRRREGWRIDEIGRVPLSDPTRGEAISNFERRAREAGSDIWGFRAFYQPAD
jgi:tRNA (guanine-N7-)-methyltransferase